VAPATSTDRDSGVVPPPRAWKGPAWNLTTRAFTSTAAIVCVVVAAALLIGSASLRQAADESAQRGLEQSADLVAQFLAGRERSLAGGARVFVQGPYFRTLVAERRRDDILDQSFEAVTQLGAKWVMITDDRGVLLAKSDEPTLVDDSLGGVPLVAGALRGGAPSGFGVSRDSLLFQAVAVPIVIPGRSPIGVLVATRLVDSAFAADGADSRRGVLRPGRHPDDGRRGCDRRLRRPARTRCRAPEHQRRATLARDRGIPWLPAGAGVRILRGPSRHATRARAVAGGAPRRGR